MIFQGRDKMRRRIKRQRWRNALFAGFLIVIINTETDRGVQAGEFGGFDIDIGAEGNWDEDLVEDVNGTVENGESEVEGKENKIVENRNDGEKADGEKADGEKNEGDKAGGDSPKGNKNGENKNGEDKNEENKVENDSESKPAKESKAKGKIADKKIAEEKKNAEAVPPAEESVGEKNENFAEKNTINENIANGVENENMVSGNIINENTAEENSINKIWEGENGASGNITGECATGEIKAEENAASGNLSTENQGVNNAEENSLSKESVTKKAEKKSKTTGDRIADKKDNGKRKNSAKETDYEMKQHAQAGSGIAFMATGLLKISAPLRFYNNTDDYIQKNKNKSKYNNKNALFYVDNNYKTGTYPLICIRGDNDIMILSLRLDGKEIAWKMEENKIILESMEYGKESCIELVAVIDGKDIVKKQF